ncbi:hypothetical protein ACU8KH_01682 [Lachancea thermotolerans]
MLFQFTNRELRENTTTFKHIYSGLCVTFTTLIKISMLAAMLATNTHFVMRLTMVYLMQERESAAAPRLALKNAHNVINSVKSRAPNNDFHDIIINEHAK